MSELQDYIHMHDKAQCDPKTAHVCKLNPEHGRLTVHGSGRALVCSAFLRWRDKGAELCEYNEILAH